MVSLNSTNLGELSQYAISAANEVLQTSRVCVQGIVYTAGSVLLLCSLLKMFQSFIIILWADVQPTLDPYSQAC